MAKPTPVPGVDRHAAQRNAHRIIHCTGDCAAGLKREVDTRGIHSDGGVHRCGMVLVPEVGDVVVEFVGVPISLNGDPIGAGSQAGYRVTAILLAVRLSNPLITAEVTDPDVCVRDGNHAGTVEDGAGNTAANVEREIDAGRVFAATARQCDGVSSLLGYLFLPVLLRVVEGCTAAPLLASSQYIYWYIQWKTGHRVGAVRVGALAKAAGPGVDRNPT